MIPGLERSPGEGNGSPVQYPCLENSMDRGAWWAATHEVAKSQTPLSDSHLHWQGYPLAVVCRLLTVLAVASPIVEHRLQGTWLQQSRLLAPRERAQQLWVHGLSCPTTCGTFPGSQVEPMSPASAGKFFTTEPPGKPLPTLKKKKKRFVYFME